MRNSFQFLIVLAAVFGLGLGIAFAGGAFWGRRNAPAASASPTAAAGAAGGLPTLGGAGAANTPTTGAVEQIDGDTITVRTQNGGTVSVKLQPDTQVRQLAPASPSDIKIGWSVIVTGQPDVDGKVAARSVQITGPAQQGGAPGQQGGTPGAQGTRPAGGAPPAAATATPTR